MLERAKSRRGVALMGICNITPDSFSDGGLYFDASKARARVLEHVREGADILDIGAESTRPGAQPVSSREQIARSLDTIAFAAKQASNSDINVPCIVSIDTSSPDVAAASLDAGACVINDVSCLKDPELARVAAQYGSAIVISHAREAQSHMRGFSDYPERAYTNIVADVVAELNAAKARAMDSGVPQDAIVLDPGLGFSKNALHSAELLKQTRELAQLVGAPLLIGASRKSFLNLVDNESSPNERIGASIAAALYARRHGASIVRVHDVRATRQALDFEQLLENGETRA